MQTRGTILMKRTLTALTLAAALFANGAWAADPDDLQKLKDTWDCVQCDLNDAYLPYANLTGANLKSANLKGANLEGTNLAPTKRARPEGPAIKFEH